MNSLGTLMSISEVADYLDISVRSVYRLIADGQLVPVGRVLGRQRFLREQVECVVVRESSVPDDVMARIVNDTLATCRP